MQELYDAWLATAHRYPVGELFEYAIEAAYRDTLRPGDWAVDGGACAARHTRPMSETVGPSGRVFAFEPIPYLASDLRRMLPSQVRVIQKAIGAAPDKAEFSWIRGGAGFSSLKNRTLPDRLEETTEHLPIEVTTIDQETGHTAWTHRFNRKVRFIKLDLEGGELDALRGARLVLSRDRPLIAFENGRADSAALYGYTVDDWFGFFESLDYVVADLFGRPFDRAGWNAPNIPWYYLAAPRGSERAAYVAETLPRRITTLNAMWPYR